jgi:hypothetical protein
VAYQLSLLESLSAVHDVFHVSQLKKCLKVPKDQLPTEDLEVFFSRKRRRTAPHNILRKMGPRKASTKQPPYGG